MCHPGVRNETESLFAWCDNGCVKRKKSRKQREKDAIAAVAKEMARPRYAVSARRNEEAALLRIRKLKKYLG